MAVTHQMVGLLAALWLAAQFPVSLGPGLSVLALVAVMAGALTPDLDQPTANMWKKMLGARALGNIFQAFSGGHRHMTHSLVGILAIGALFYYLINTFLRLEFIPPARIAWIAFMIGYISHPIADTLTDRGVPWLWPFNIHFKIPPGPEEVRVTTGSFVENLLVRGGLIIAALFLLTQKWGTYLSILSG
ncbi:MAG: metal-dependent hydrolase [Acidobacteriota bacterium]